MNKFILLFLILLITGNIFSQTIEENVLFTLDLKGDVQLYNFIYDDKSGYYCYVYTMEDQKKNFLISPKGESEKYDYFMVLDIKFDSKGNYFAVAGNYENDYGMDNNFLIVNGKTLKGLEYIESFSSFINKNDEYVFTFKIKDDYYMGYVKGDGSFRQSEKFEYVKPIYQYIQERDMEGDAEQVDDSYFYKNKNGDRGFIVIKNGKAGMMFEEVVTMTDYSDIHESSLTFNKNNELSFIAKNGGRFYVRAGNEFVVSGNKKYKDFDYVNPPVLFNNENEPIYKAADSTEQYLQNSYLVSDNSRLPLKFEESDESKIPLVIYEIYDIKLSENGDISYFASADEIIPADPTKENSFEQYYVKTFFVKNGKAFPLGYNVGKIINDAEGNMIYSGIADLGKKEYLLMQSNGESIIIIGQGNYDQISDYGLLKSGEFYYFGQKYSDEEKGIKGNVKYYNGNNLIGEYDNVSFQNYENGAVMIQFSPDGNGYVLSVDENKSPGEYLSYLVNENGKMNFPGNALTGSGKFLNILNLFYTADGKIFYTGITEMDTTNYTYTEEVFTENKSLGKYYGLIQNLNYDKTNNSLKFIASRKNKIYSVSVKF